MKLEREFKTESDRENLEGCVVVRKKGWMIKKVVQTCGEKSSGTPRDGATCVVEMTGLHPPLPSQGASPCPEAQRHPSLTRQIFILGEGSEIGVPVPVEHALKRFRSGERSNIEVASVKVKLYPEITVSKDEENGSHKENGPQPDESRSQGEKTGSGGEETRSQDAHSQINDSEEAEYRVELIDFRQLPGHWELTADESLAYALTFKNRGTDFFKAEKFTLAKNYYKKAILYLQQPCNKLQRSLKQATAAEQTTTNSATNALSQCSDIDCGDSVSVLHQDLTDRVLDKGADTSQTGTLIKPYYRDATSDKNSSTVDDSDANNLIKTSSVDCEEYNETTENLIEGNISAIPPQANPTPTQVNHTPNPTSPNPSPSNPNIDTTSLNPIPTSRNPISANPNPSQGLEPVVLAGQAGYVLKPMEDVSNINPIEQSTACQLNLALCYLKIGKNLSALESCNKVLDVEPNNVKALYRRGLAHMAVDNINLAMSDFTAVLSIDPANKAAVKQLTAAKLRLSQHQTKEKQLFSGMFNKFSHLDTMRQELREGRGGDVFSEVGEWSNDLAQGMMTLEQEMAAFGEKMPEPKYNNSDNKENEGPDSDYD